MFDFWLDKKTDKRSLSVIIHKIKIQNVYFVVVALKFIFSLLNWAMAWLD